MMKHRLLGGSGLRVSELCLGTLGFGEQKAWGTPEQEARKIIYSFAKAGGSFIDTAPNYADGEAERIVGRAVQGARDEFVIGTKYTASIDRHPIAGGNSRRSLMRSVEASLQRLNTDRIDILFLHFWDGTAPLEEILRGLEDCITAGKILYTGFSDTPAWLVSRAVTMSEWRGWVRPAAIQAEYNVVSRDIERDLAPMADALDLGILCWGPLAAGALAAGDAPKRRAASKSSSTLVDGASKLASIGLREGIAPAVLALAWLMRQVPSRIPIVGARTESQLWQLVAACDCKINGSLMSEIATIAPPSLGFPHDLINSSYLRRFALGDVERLASPEKLRC